MNHLSVGFDVDDVLLPTGPNVIAWHNDKYGTKLTMEHWYLNPSPEVWQVESGLAVLERVNGFVNTDEFLSMIQPVEGVEEVFAEMEAAGDRKFAVTSRPLYLAAMTHTALELCYPGHFPEGSVYLINHSTIDRTRNKQRKVEIALQENATHFVDDLQEHLRPMVQAGIRPLLSGRYPHNEVITIPGLMRVPNMNALKLELRHDRAA